MRALVKRFIADKNPTTVYARARVSSQQSGSPFGRARCNAPGVVARASADTASVFEREISAMRDGRGSGGAVSFRWMGFFFFFFFFFWTCLGWGREKCFMDMFGIMPVR